MPMNPGPNVNHGWVFTQHNFSVRNLLWTILVRGRNGVDIYSVAIYKHNTKRLKSLEYV